MVVLSSDELLRNVMRALCTSKILTTEDIKKELKLSETEAETLLSVLVGEGLLIRVEAGTTCSCAGCPLRVVCKIKAGNESNMATVTYYRLSNSGLKFCERYEARLSQ